MEKELYEITDLRRILVGNVPPEFFIEVFIRLAFVYLVLQFSMKFMGKRMASQLNVSEFAALTALAGGTGLIILSPDRGLLPMIVVAAVIILIERLLAHRSVLDKKFESAAVGRIDTVAENGVLNLEVIGKTNLSQEKIFSDLRANEIRQLGEVAEMFFEASGLFTVLKSPNPRPGLSVMPQWDKKIREKQPKREDTKACLNCGATLAATVHSNCQNCGRSDFETAVL